MNKTKKLSSSLLLVLIILLISKVGISQKPIDVSVNIFPPYPTNLHQYADDFRTYSFLVTNTTSSPQSVYLSVVLLGDNGVRIGFNPSFKPSEPIELEPLQIKMVTGSELEAIYGGISGDDVSIEGLSLSNQLSGQLPEGNYNLCVFAYDFQSGLLLSTGCSFSYTTTYATIPEIIFPRNGDVLPPTETMPLNIIWSPPSQGAGSALTYEYTIKILDLTEQQNTDVEALFLSGGIPVVLEKVVNGVNYLYDAEGDDLPLIVGHAYGIRVQAMDGNMTPLENQGFSEIVTFTFSGGMINPDGDDEVPLPTDCASRCNLPSVTDTLPLLDITGLDNIKIGHFPIQNINLTGSGDGRFTGTAEVKLDFLNNLRVSIRLTAIKVNSSGRIFAGSVKAIQDISPEISDLLDYVNLGNLEGVAETGAASIPPNIAEPLGQLLKTTKLVTGLLGGNSVELPIGINQSLMGNTVTFGITDINFSPQGAKATLVAALKLPQLVDNNWIMLKGDSVCLHPQGFGGSYNLKLGEDLHLFREDSTRYAIILKASGVNACNISMGCDGLNGISIGGELLMPRKLMVPEDADGEITDGKVKANFFFTENRPAGNPNVDLGMNWLASIDFERFQLTKLKGWTFDISTAFWDFSDLDNPSDIIFPTGYTAIDSTFQGIYIKNASIKPPKKMLADQNETLRTAINISNIIIDPALYFDFNVTNIMSIGEGNLDGWAFSVDTFRLSIFANSLVEGQLKGQLHVPILDTSTFITYGASIIDDGNNYEYLFNAGISDTISIPLLLARGNIFDDTYFEVEFDPINPLGSNVHAYIHGNISINTDGQDLDLPTNINLPYLDLMIGVDSKQGIIQEETAISFVGFGGNSTSTASTTTPSSDEASSQSSSKNVGGFPINLEDFNVGLEVMGNNEIGVTFQVALSLDIGSEDVGGVSAGFKIVSEMPMPNLNNVGESIKSYKFKRVQFDSIALYANLGPVEVDGKLMFYNEPLEGGGRNKGIKGEINALVKAGVEISGRLRLNFGTYGVVPQVETSSYSDAYYPYYNVDGQIMISTGIMIATGVALYGISGGISKNMVQTSTPTSNGFTFAGQAVYSPYFGSTGFGFGVTLGTHPDPQAFNADISFRAQIIDGGVDMITIAGAGYIMCPVTDRSNPKVMADINMTLLTQRPGRPFSMDGMLRLAINIGDGMLVGNMDGGTIPNQMVEASFHASAETWFFYMGAPEFNYNDDFDPRGSARLNLLGVIQADLKAYFMVGHGVPTQIPPLPPAIYNILNNPEGSFSGTSASSAQNGLGGVDFSTGAGFANGAYVEVRADIDAYLLFASLNVYLGYDLNITKRTTTCINGGEIGINGWYAEGQAYAGLTGAMGLRIKLLGRQTDFNLFELAAAIALNAGGPNPFYFTGRASVYYNILNGKIKGSSTFGLDVGERCSPLNLDPFAGINFYDFISPSTGATEQFPGRSMQVKTTLPVFENLVIPTPLLDNNGDLIRVRNDSYRPELSWTIKRMGNHPNLPTSTYWVNESSKNEVFITPQTALTPNKEYELKLSIKAWDYQTNTWLRAVDANGLETSATWSQDTTILFTTGSLPPDLYNYVSYTYPLPNERYFMHDDATNGKIVFHQQINENFYFPVTDVIGANYQYFVRYTNLNTETKVDIPFTYVNEDGEHQLKFAIPQLDLESYYVMQVIRKRPGLITTVAVNNTANKRYKEIYRAGSGDERNAISTSLEIEDTAPSSPETVLAQNEFLLYHNFFRTSKFNRLSEKLDNLVLTNTTYFGENHVHYGKRVLVKFTSEEPFEKRDFNDFQLSVGQGPPYNFKSRIGLFDLFNQSYHDTKVEPIMFDFKNALLPFAFASWPDNTVMDWTQPMKYRLPAARVKAVLSDPIEENEYAQLWSNFTLNPLSSNSSNRNGTNLTNTSSLSSFDLVFDTHYAATKDQKTIADFYSIPIVILSLSSQWPTTAQINTLKQTNFKLNNANDGLFKFYFGRNQATSPNADLIDIFNGKFKSFTTPNTLTVINPR